MKIGVVVAVCVLLALSIFFVRRPTAPVMHADIVLTDGGFTPATITLRKGGTVTFSTNVARPFWPASNDHPTHLIYPAFDPKQPVAANSTWSFTFVRVGDWGFHDHLRSYFTGDIHVVE